jgi:hypothetical protein
LRLPSDLNSSDWTLVCSNDLCEKEAEMRFAQATDALEDLRHCLRLRSMASNFKRGNITGQRPNTKARTYQTQIEGKIHAHAGTYRRARAAYFRLVGPGTWENELRVLEQPDIRALNERALTEREKEERVLVLTMGGMSEQEASETVDGKGGDPRHGEARRSISWIWYQVGTHQDLDDISLHNGAAMYSAYSYLHLI